MIILENTTAHVLSNEERIFEQEHLLTLTCSYKIMRNTIVFFSTKKRKAFKGEWSKPSLEKTKECKLLLQRVETKYCAVCLQQEDHYNEDLVIWFECNHVHCGCTVYAQFNLTRS